MCIVQTLKANFFTTSEASPGKKPGCHGAVTTKGGFIVIGVGPWPLLGAGMTEVGAEAATRAISDGVSAATGAPGC